MSSWYTIQRLSALSRLITAVGVSDIGKERWFEQTDGRWYDRRKCDYIDFNTMIDRVESTIIELEENR